MKLRISDFGVCAGGAICNPKDCKRFEDYARSYCTAEAKISDLKKSIADLKCDFRCPPEPEVGEPGHLRCWFESMCNSKWSTDEWCDPCRTADPMRTELAAVKRARASAKRSMMREFLRVKP